MLALDVLRDTTEQRKSNGTLDVIVSINGWGNAFDDLGVENDRISQCYSAFFSMHNASYLLSNALIFTHVGNKFLVVVSKSIGGEHVFLLVDVVGFDDGGEYRESVLGAEGGVKVVAVDPSNFL
jgi:hypothetical protein